MNIGLYSESEYSPMLKGWTLSLTQRLPKESSQTRRAVILSTVTLLLLMVVTIITHTIHSKYSNYNDQDRLLEDGADYTQYTCDTIFRYTEPNSEQRCDFSKSCNSGAGLFCSFVFCNTWNLSLLTWCLLLSPMLFTWLVLLFRMLGSTAEDFFSPSLEMFSVKMGLPPRFAGVTLLALGNGAADVSATISAITLNPEKGYQMSLGALTGAGMFVGTIVAGIVILTAGGVKCRGALVRDVIMFMFTIMLVYYFFSQGAIGPLAISSFFWSYFSFVIVVLCADIYHRAVVLPRIQKENENSQPTTTVISDIAEGSEDLFSSDPSVEQASEVELAGARTVNHSPPSHAFQSSLHSPIEESSNQDMLLAPSSIRKTRDQKTFTSKLDRFMIAMSNYGIDEGTSGNRPSGWNGLEVTPYDKDHHLKLHGATGLLNKRSVSSAHDETDQSNHGPSTTYTVLMESVENMCTLEGSLVSSMGISWSQSISLAREELQMHFADFIEDLKENDEYNVFDRFFLFCELPFTILRKVSLYLKKY